MGGFDESFKRAEDDELGLRLHRYGCRFHFEPEAIAWHYSNRSLEAWLAIPRAYAHYDIVMDRQYPDLRLAGSASRLNTAPGACRCG